MARGSAEYTKGDGLRAAIKRNLMFWPCSAAANGDTLVVAGTIRNSLLVREAAT